MARYDEVPISRVRKNAYSLRKGFVVELDTTTPTAIGTIEQSQALRERLPVLQIIRPGITINDCVFSDSYNSKPVYDEFRQVAKDDLGMQIFGAPLGMLSLAGLVDIDRVIGLGDGNFVQLPNDLFNRGYWETVHGKVVLRKINKLNEQESVNNLIYTSLAKHWNGMDLQVAIKSIAANYSQSIQLKFREEMNKLMEDSNDLNDNGRKKLRELVEYWDFLPREIRRYCKTDHARRRLVSNLENLSSDEYILGTALLPENGVPQDLAIDLAEEMSNFNEYWTSNMHKWHLRDNIFYIGKFVEEGYGTQNRYASISGCLLEARTSLDEAINSGRADKSVSASLKLSSLEGLLEDINYRNRVINKSIKKRSISYTDRDWFYSPSRNEFMDRLNSLLKTLTFARNRSNAEVNSTVMRMYADQGYIVYETENGKRYPPLEVSHLENRAYLNTLGVGRNVKISDLEDLPAISKDISLDELVEGQYLACRKSKIFNLSGRLHAVRTNKSVTPITKEFGLNKGQLLRQTELRNLRIRKGDNFEDLARYGEICPMGLGSKWDTWKFIYSADKIEAAKWYLRGETPVRISFDTNDYINIEPKERIMLSVPELTDLVNTIEAIDLRISRRTGRRNPRDIEIEMKPIRSEKVVIIDLETIPEKLSSDFYVPLKRFLKSKILK